MLRTTLDQNQIRTLQLQAQVTLDALEKDRERKLHQYYEAHKHFRKGDRKGIFATHKADQTYEQYDRAELERYCRHNSFFFKNHNSPFYRMKHNLYDWQIEKLEELIRELTCAVQFDLQQVTVEVNNLAVIAAHPHHKLSCSKSDTEPQ